MKIISTAPAMVIGFALTIGFFMPIAEAQTTNFTSKDYQTFQSQAEDSSTQVVPDAGLKEKTERAIQESKEALGQVQKEAEKRQEEKIVIEKQAQLKEDAAQIAQREAEVLKKEAQISNDPSAAKKARELSLEAERLSKEAELAREKLILAEQKAKIAQATHEAELLKVELLEKELLEAKKAQAAGRPILEKVARAAAFILIGLVLYFALKIILKNFNSFISQKDAIRETEAILRMKTVSKIFHWLGNILIVAIVAYMALDNLGFNMAPLLAGVGIVGLAFGFGGQYLIRDLINGLFILIEGQYRVNDVVKLNEYGGLVEDINLRVTTLRDLEGRVIIVPNGEVKTVVNFTKSFAYALFDIGVAYKENVDRVMQVIKEEGKQIKSDSHYGRLILDDLEMLGVDDFADSQVTIKFRIKTLPIKQWEISREFKRRLKNRFDELGIEIPFPHRTLYWGAGADNDWFRRFAENMSPKNPS